MGGGDGGGKEEEGEEEIEMLKTVLHTTHPTTWGYSHSIYKSKTELITGKKC